MSPLRRIQLVWSVHHLLGQLVVIYPVYAIMMTRRGIDEVELSALLALWSVSVIAAEVFTGALADRVARTRVLIASRLLKGSCFLAWIILPGFWGYLAGFLCWGIASSLRSGAEESMLHDQLLAMGWRDQFEKVYGRAVASGTGRCFRFVRRRRPSRRTHRVCTSPWAFGCGTVARSRIGRHGDVRSTKERVEDGPSRALP